MPFMLAPPHAPSGEGKQYAEPTPRLRTKKTADDQVRGRGIQSRESCR